MVMKNLFRYLILFSIGYHFIVSCRQETLAVDKYIPAFTPGRTPFFLQVPLTGIEQYMDSLGLVDILKKDTSFQVDLMYARANNFTGKILYTELTKAYLHPDAANALIKAQALLKQKYPYYSLIIFDAARPMSVQQKMWNTVKNTSRARYVSNPAHGGGLHNYGLAVDLSIIDTDGNLLPMGTKVDHLGKESHINQEFDLVKEGKITEKERQNRILLRNIMKKAGFKPLPTEWWHFNFCNRETARQKYKLIK